MKQLKTCGRVGYTTMKPDDPKKIHPSKKITILKVPSMPSSSILPESREQHESSNESVSDSGSDYNPSKILIIEKGNRGQPRLFNWLLVQS